MDGKRPDYMFTAFKPGTQLELYKILNLHTQRRQELPVFGIYSKLGSMFCEP